MRPRPMIVPMLLTGAALTMMMQAEPWEGPGYTRQFGLENVRSLVPDGRNLYFSLVPGTFSRFEGEDDGEEVLLEITVLDAVRPVTFVVNGHERTALTRIVEEREWIDGELAQLSMNYFARCADSSNIYYFGEDVEHYEDGEVVSREGTWLAGANGTAPGLMMPGLFLNGSRYFQGIARGVSMDRCEHVSTGMRFQTPVSLFKECVMVRETSPLEPDEETLKVYAPGVGLVYDHFLTLVEHHD